MNRTRLFAILIAGLSFGGTLSLLRGQLRGQAPSASLGQQLRSQYRVSSADADAKVVRVGSVLIVAQDGLKANPAFGPFCWYNSHKPGDRIKYSKVYESAKAPADLGNQVRLLQVGEKVVVLRMDITQSEVGVCVQTYSDNPGDTPYRASVLFQFPQKDFVQPGNLKAVQDSIAEVFSIDTSKPEALVPARAPQTPGGPEVAGPSLDQVAGLYLMAQAPANHLQLNSDGTLALFQGGQNYSGVFTIEGNRIVGRIGTGPQQQTGVLQGDTIVDPNGSVWVKQKAAPAAAVPLKLPSTYVSAQAPADHLLLNADNSFSLQAGGETYHGTFVVSGNTVELSIRETGDKTTATIQGNNNLTDSNGQAWVRREQSADSAPDGPALKNEDIIKLAKAGLDDELIIAKINGSKCQFDTSTDALIQLKKSGVSAAVLKAIMGAGTTVRAERASLVAANAAYFGVWNKTETGGYVKVIISGSSEKPRVHLWGSCLPQNCDDGEADGRWDGSTLITTFRLNNQPVEFRLTLDRSVNLQLNCHSPTGTNCVTMSYTKSTSTRP